ncbi:hypothetical protein AM588_10001147 [Phytophthora nicotianae]|uniref:ATP-dependent DNA helicase n=1 Tax=Phytophthora nicotianae TaxID=4792 RepID=A0A0W8CQZ7_PHYNI|nr:hypothetical protein AM588_10001147 [Phytophthora nicotianae]
MPQAVATAAYQGVAAQAANGQTIHKLFGWYVNSRRQWAPTSEQKDRFSRLKLLILDEVSTCDVSIIGKIDSSLRKFLDRSNAVFGGVHVLLVGDWLQPLPVAGQPAFMSADELLESRSRQQSNTSDYLDRLLGINAYKALTSVVILTENMRHQHDPVWRTILVKWRVGNYDQKDIDLVNDIAYSKNWTSSAASLESYCPIIVTSNALRVEFNFSTLRSFCQKSNVPLHRFPATVRRPRHPLTKFQRKSLGSIRDDKISGMPINLEIALGSTVQCTKNVSTTFNWQMGQLELSSP